MVVVGKAARQKAFKKEGTTLTQFFQKRAPVTSSTGAQTSSKGLLPVKSEPMEVCVQGALLPESAVTVTTAVKEKKWDVSAFPSTSQDIKPVLRGDACSYSYCSGQLLCINLISLYSVDCWKQTKKNVKCQSIPVK